MRSAPGSASPSCRIIALGMVQRAFSSTNSSLNAQSSESDQPFHSRQARSRARCDRTACRVPEGPQIGCHHADHAATHAQFVRDSAVGGPRGTSSTPRWKGLGAGVERRFQRREHPYTTDSSTLSILLRKTDKGLFKMECTPLAHRDLQDERRRALRLTEEHAGEDCGRPPAIAHPRTCPGPSTPRQTEAR